MLPNLSLGKFLGVRCGWGANDIINDCKILYTNILREDTNRKEKKQGEILLLHLYSVKTQTKKKKNSVQMDSKSNHTDRQEQW